jgi:hypothetical protein
MAVDSQALTTTGHVSVDHSPVGGLSHDARGGISNPILGMILFICSEIMFFSTVSRPTSASVPRPRRGRRS